MRIAGDSRTPSCAVLIAGITRFFFSAGPATGAARAGVHVLLEAVAYAAATVPEGDTDSGDTCRRNIRDGQRTTAGVVEQAGQHVAARVRAQVGIQDLKLLGGQQGATALICCAGTLDRPQYQLPFTGVVRQLDRADRRHPGSAMQPLCHGLAELSCRPPERGEQGAGDRAAHRGDHSP